MQAPVAWLPFRLSMRSGAALAALAGAVLLAAFLLQGQLLPPGSPFAGRASAAAPLLVFGVVADAQYADVEAGASVRGTPRYYRESLGAVRRAVAAWSAVANLSFAVHLGDTVDGKAAAGGAASSERAFGLILAALRALRPAPVHYLLGNHDLYQEAVLGFDRVAQLLRVDGGSDAAGAGAEPCAPGPASVCSWPAGKAYRSLSPVPSLRLVLLDTFEVSPLGGRPGAAAAAALLASRNPAANQNSPDLLRGSERRFVKLNGGLGAQQLAWLDAQLSAAAAQRQRVLLFSHIALHPGAHSRQCGPMCAAWDGAEAVAVVRRHRAGGLVLAAFAGHDHFGGYARDGGAGGSGAHFVTLQGLIETPRGGDSYGEVSVLADGTVVLAGHGRMRSFTLRPAVPMAAGGEGGAG